jgi:hypothetical protein
MQHFELSLNEEINVYINSGMTPTELFILRLLFLAVDGDQRYLINYISNISDGKKILRQVLESLKVKKVINSTFNIPKEGEALNFKNIPFNKATLKTYIRESNELGKEFFYAYPEFIIINGKSCSIRNITKANLFSFEDFCIYYSKSIKSSGVTHERVMEALEFAKANNLINYSIIEFVASKKYLEIEHVRTSGDINNYKNSELL